MEIRKIVCDSCGKEVFDFTEMGGWPPSYIMFKGTIYFGDAFRDSIDLCQECTKIIMESLYSRREAIRRENLGL